MKNGHIIANTALSPPRQRPLYGHPSDFGIVGCLVRPLSLQCISLGLPEGSMEAMKQSGSDLFGRGIPLLNSRELPIYSSEKAAPVLLPP